MSGTDLGYAAMPSLRMSSTDVGCGAAGGGSAHGVCAAVTGEERTFRAAQIQAGGPQCASIFKEGRSWVGEGLLRGKGERRERRENGLDGSHTSTCRSQCAV
eukprot:3744967-Rhodomonas_salina.1